MARQSKRAGGDEGNRTPNPRLAKAVLCQLSYVPGRGPAAQRRGRAVRSGGLAPEVGLGLGRARACGRASTAPPAATATSTTSFFRWLLLERRTALAVDDRGMRWAWEDLNLRPHPYQGCALTD